MGPSASSHFTSSRYECGASNTCSERRAKIFGLQVHPLKLENPPYDFEAAFGSLAAASTQTLLVLSSAALVLLIGGLAEHQRYVRDLCLLALLAAGALAAVHVTQARAKP